MTIIDKAYETICKRLKDKCTKYYCEFVDVISFIPYSSEERILVAKCMHSNIAVNIVSKNEEFINITVKQECLSRKQIVNIVINALKKNDIVVMRNDVVLHKGESLESLAIEWDMKAGML